MNAERLNKLKNTALAAKAKPGETDWYTEQQFAGYATPESDVAFIVAMTPCVALELIAIAERALAAHTQQPAPQEPVAWMIQDAADVEIPGTGTCKFSRDNPADYGYGGHVTPLYAAAQAPAQDNLENGLDDKTWTKIRYNGFTYNFSSKLPLQQVFTETLELIGESAPSQADSRDAARYRWLRNPESNVSTIGSQPWDIPTCEKLDRLIDAAMSSTTGDATIREKGNG